MTDVYKPFKELFKDVIIAKNLLAENVCKTCIHCKTRYARHKYYTNSNHKDSYSCILKEISTTLKNTCEDYEFSKIIWAYNGIQEN